MKNKSIIFLVMVVLFISSSVAAQAGQVVEVTESKTEDISLDELITGTLTPIQDVDIPAQTGGVAEKVNVEIGDEIEAGSELIKIDDQTLLIQKRQSEAALESARANYNELKNGATEEEMTRVKSSYENAKNSLESAKTNLKLMEELYNNRRSLEQQLVSAEQQLENSKQSLNQAQINYDQAKKDYQRSKKLYADNVISENKLDQAENSFENAESSLSQAKTSLSVAERNYQLTKATYDNPTELKQQLENARNQVENAQSNLEVSKANLDEAERGPREEKVRAGLASLRQAEASLDQTKDQISKTKITASFTGVVNQVNVDQGEMISNGQTVVNLINIDELYAEIGVTAATASAIKKGELVKVKPETMQHFIDGEITNIAPAADSSSRTFLVKVKIENKDHKLRAGMFADVSLAKGKAGQAVVVPIESIVDLNSDQPYIFVIESGKALRKDIQIGIATDSKVEILAGLTAGEEVVIRGQSNLEDGQSVEVRNR
ncbi:MAG: efflux RND transporter periplasmic adaptor subunit [Bacillota bacterium]